MRVLNFSDGFTSATEPTQGLINATGLQSYANDAAYAAGIGRAAQAGDIYYNTSENRIRYHNGSGFVRVVPETGVTGSIASPVSVTAGGGITPGAFLRQVIFVQGSPGAVDISANPQIVAGSIVGQELILMGASAVNTVLIEHGNGLVMNGPLELDDETVISLMWTGSVWREVSRQ